MRALLAAVLLLAPAAASAVTILAEVNKTAVALGDQVVLAVTVSGAQASLPKPRLPSFEDFEAYESGTNQSYSFINGKMSSSVVYTYVLAPRKTGKARVPAISIEVDGKPVATDPIDILVSAAGAPTPRAAPSASGASSPAPAPRADGAARPDVFLSASVDKPRAYAGEQVTLTVRFHAGVPLMGSVQYDAPKLEGFLSEDLGQGQTSANHGGRTYHVTEVKTALFPVHGGRLPVGAAVARTSVARGGGVVGGGDLFERFFSMSAPQPVTARSEPVAVEALPLPDAGRPEGFSGAVGRYRVKATVDRARLKVGEAATLTVEVSGTGNLRSVGEPARAELSALRFFDTESSVSVTKTDGVVGGTKVLKTVFVPRASGVVVIPPLVLWHFDPEKRAYVKAESAALRLDVEAGAPGAAAPGGASAPALGVVTRDIRYLKSGPVRGAASRALAAFAGLGALHALPLLVLLGAAGADWRRRRLDADPAGRRARGAAARAEAALSAALAAPDAASASAAAMNALAGYVGDRFGVPAAGLTSRRAQDLLASGGATAAAVAAYAEAWRDVEAARYAPPGSADAAAHAVVEKARAALAALEARS